MPRSWEASPPPAWAPTVTMLRRTLYLPPEGSLGGDVDMFFDQAHIAVTNWVQVRGANAVKLNCSVKVQLGNR